MLQVYIHDGAATLTFVLTGDLVQESVLELEHSWVTASSILRGKRLVVDLARLSSMDEAGIALLARMSRDGASFLTASESMDALASQISGRVPRLLAVPPPGEFRRWLCRFTRCCRRVESLFAPRKTCGPQSLKVW